VNNILTRDFSPREKALLVVLGIIIIGALYYLLIFQPVNDGIATAKASADDLEIQLLKLDNTVAQIKNMQKSINSLDANGHIMSIMPSYNAGKQELDFLHTTLAASEDYYVGFKEITRQGDQIRREFELKFTVDEYSEAEDIINNLEHSELRCLISDFKVTTVEQKSTIDKSEVEVSCTATFYETMYDGKEDAELPPDEKKSDSDVQGTYEYESVYD
jgi:hypothetical protein